MNLSELIEKSQAFVEGQMTEDEYVAVIKELTIRNYLSQNEKRDVVATVYTLGSDYATLEYQLVDLYMYEFFYGLLRYIMVDVDDPSLVNDENMDLLSPLLRDYIYSFAKNDFEIVCRLVSDTIALYNIDQISDTMMSLSEEAIMEGIMDNARMLNSFKDNKDIIDKISKIQNMNDPLTHEMLQAAIKEEYSKREKEPAIPSVAPIVPPVMA